MADRVDEGRWTRNLTEEGVRGLRKHPGYLATVLHQNTLGFFEIDPTLNRFAEDSDGRLWQFRQAALPLYWLVTVGGLTGLALAVQRRQPLMVVLVLTTVQFVALSLLLVAPPRLRGPFDLAMCVGVGLLVAEGRARRGEAVDVSG